MPEIGESATTPRKPQLPDKLWIGDFILDVETFARRISWNNRLKHFSHISGTAWLNFDCTDLPHLIEQLSKPDDVLSIRQNIEVVKTVIHPQTQVSLDVARHIQPGIQLGETLQLKTAATSDTLQKLAAGDLTLLDIREQLPTKGQILVEFKNVTIKKTTTKGIGRIVEGEAVYPAKQHIPKKLQLKVDGFTLSLTTISLTPKGANADITVHLPGDLIDRSFWCYPAS